MRSNSGLSLEKRAPLVKLGQSGENRTPNSEPTQIVLTIANKVFQALDAHQLMSAMISPEGSHRIRIHMPVSGRGFVWSFNKLVPVAIGKASPWMSNAFCRLMGGYWPGLGVCSEGTAYGCEGWAWLHGDHPIPGARSFHAGGAVAKELSSVASNDLIVLLLSGGASSLAVVPKGVSTTGLASLTEGLLRAGASIHELNALRRRLDLLKGGGFARLAAPAQVISLVLSDVPGNRLVDIGSGPTAGPAGDEPKPWGLLEHAGLSSLATPQLEQLLRSRNMLWPFPRPLNLVIGSNETALHGAAQAATALGYSTRVYPESLTGEAREMGKSLASAVERIMPVKERTCLLFGGETVVTVVGRGEGGRNLELALSFALHSYALPGITMMALATDGKDGTSPAAGAAVHSDIFLSERDLVAAENALENNDTYPYLAQRNATLHTGPTGTNVADIACVLLDPN